MARQERADQLWQAIDSLDEPHRLVIILAAIEGQDIASVARLLEIPEGTVKSRLHSARSRIREMLS